MNRKSKDTPPVRSELELMVPYEPGKPEEEIMREYGLEERPVKLASNENPYPPPEDVIKAFREQGEHLNRYPDGGCFYLKEAIADRYDRSPEEVVVGGGSDEVLDCLGKTMLSPGDEVLAPWPGFIRYKMIAQMMGATTVNIPTGPEMNINLDELLESVSERTRWICLPNPNNPTSRYVTESDLIETIGQIPDHVTIIMDEAYFEFMNQDDYPDGLKVAKRFPGKTIIVLRTFSKAFGLAGLRVGYGLMSPELAREIDKVRPPFNVTRPAQEAARMALKNPSYVEEIRKKIHEERQRITRELENRAIDFISPSANFLLFQPPGTDSGREFCERCMEKGVILRPMDPYELPEYVRLTVGTPEENDRFFHVLDGFTR
ncbi:MAG: histidinol-phosphate transaminase [bacterium]